MHHCPNCSKALHDQHHQCGDEDDEDGDDISGPQLLDLPACEEISNSKTLTAEQKYTALIDRWSVFCQASVQKFPRGHIVYWNYISISKHNTWWMVMVLSERGWY
jgi:hypothetical protein